MDCNERRTTREYASLSSGHVNFKRILNEGLGILNTKVIKTFNVVGSNWSVRRIINLNATIMYDIISFTFLSRLVKGKAEEITSTVAEGELIVDAKKLQTLFTLLYDGVSNNRVSRETIRKMVIGK